MAIFSLVLEMSYLIAGTLVNQMNFSFPNGEVGKVISR